MSKYQDAVGLTVVSVHRDGDDVVLVTKHGEKNIVLSPYGDCCSTTWIESIDLVDSLYGTILSIEDIDMHDVPAGSGATLEHPHVDSVQLYGLRIKTTSGIAVLDYRNDSNGYYGGSLDMTLTKKRK